MLTHLGGFVLCACLAIVFLACSSEDGDSGRQSGGGAGGSAGSVAGSGGSLGGSDGGGPTCNVPGATCCDPFPGDGPNYCVDGLVCGAMNTCEESIDCNCALGAYVPVCGTDGQTHDATCGMECVPVAIACNGECPCP